MAPTAVKKSTRVVKRGRKSSVSKADAPTPAASEKKYRARLPEKGTLASYTTRVLGTGKLKFVKGKVYVVSLSDARLLRKLELLPGKKVFEISEVMEELEALEALDELEEADALEPAETADGEVDLTATVVGTDKIDVSSADEKSVAVN